MTNMTNMSNIIVELEELLTDPRISSLIASIKINKSLKYIERDQSLLATYVKNLPHHTLIVYRSSVAGFINKHYFDHNANFDKLYFEKKFDLERLLIAAIHIEHAYSGYPKEEVRMPFSYVTLAEELSNANKNWSAIHATYSKNYTSSKNVGDGWFVNYL